MKINVDADLVAAVAAMPNDKIVVMTICLAVLLVVFRLWGHLTVCSKSHANGLSGGACLSRRF